MTFMKKLKNYEKSIFLKVFMQDEKELVVNPNLNGQ